MKTRYLLIALAGLAAPAFALNMSVFKDAPLTRLTPDEEKAFSTVIIDTLDNGSDGVTVEWKAPKTVFTSKITPGKNFADGKRSCREVTIESEAKDRFQRGNYSFCKVSGKWQLTTPGSKPAKQK
jgi:surface antigen